MGSGYRNEIPAVYCKVGCCPQDYLRNAIAQGAPVRLTYAEVAALLPGTTLTGMPLEDQLPSRAAPSAIALLA